MIQRWKTRWLDGECWDFALALAEMVERPVFVAVGDRWGMHHVGLRVGDRFADVRGILDQSEFAAPFGGGTVYEVCRADVEFNCGLAAVEPPYEEITEIAAARKAVRRAFPRGLPAVPAPDGPSFDGKRRPLDDETAEAARTEAYWRWLDSRALDLADLSFPESVLADGRRWVQLHQGADADYEAFHMRHSIGHSWHKYSLKGSIYGLRSADNLPEATVMVVTDHARDAAVVVHAREHGNARLSDRNQAALEAFAAAQGWEIQPDPMPFDVLSGAGGPNTRIKYLWRDADNTKSVGAAVLRGRLSEAQITAVADGLAADRTFLPAAVGLDDLSGAGLPHEVLSLKEVADEPTCRIDAEAFCSAWSSAAQQGWTVGSFPAPGLPR